MLRMSTCGGNLLACAAVLARICELVDPQLPEAVAEREALMLNGM